MVLLLSHCSLTCVPAPNLGALRSFPALLALMSCQQDQDQCLHGGAEGCQGLEGILKCWRCPKWGAGTIQVSV